MAYLEIPIRLSQALPVPCEFNDVEAAVRQTYGDSPERRFAGLALLAELLELVEGRDARTTLTRWLTRWRRIPVRQRMAIAVIAAAQPALHVLEHLLADAEPLIDAVDPSARDLVERAEQIIEAAESVTKMISDLSGDNPAGDPKPD